MARTDNFLNTGSVLIYRTNIMFAAYSTLLAASLGGRYSSANRSKSISWGSGKSYTRTT